MAPALLVLGLFLCFWGGRLVKPALRVSALAAGGFLGYWIGARLGKPDLTWIIAGVGGLAAMVLVMFAFNAGLFIIGALAGAILYNALITVVAREVSQPWWGVIAAAVVGGIVVRLLHKRIMKVMTAVVGGYLVVEAGARLAAGDISGWGSPPTWAMPVLRDAAWFILTFAGIMAQRPRSSRIGEN